MSTDLRALLMFSTAWFCSSSLQLFVNLYADAEVAQKTCYFPNAHKRFPTHTHKRWKQRDELRYSIHSYTRLGNVTKLLSANDKHHSRVYAIQSHFFSILSTNWCRISVNRMPPSLFVWNNWLIDQKPYQAKLLAIIYYYHLSTAEKSNAHMYGCGCIQIRSNEIGDDFGAIKRIESKRHSISKCVCFHNLNRSKI